MTLDLDATLAGGVVPEGARTKVIEIQEDAYSPNMFQSVKEALENSGVGGGLLYTSRYQQAEEAWKAGASVIDAWNGVLEDHHIQFKKKGS